MNFLKIKQVIALIILSTYFLFKSATSLSFVTLISNTKTTKPPAKQHFTYLLGSGHGYIDWTCSNKSIMEDDGRCFYEWIFNWEVRNILAKMLDSANIKYHFVNTDIHSDMSIDDRAKIASDYPSKKPKIYISIHANAASKSQPGWERVKGFEVFSPESKYIIDGAYNDKKEFSDTLATWMAQEIMKEFPSHNLRTSSKQLYKEASFTVISKSKCYSILTENEFFTNKEMRDLMRTEHFRYRVAKAHFQFIKKIERNYKKNQIN